jgi:hypothetical protein
MNNKNNYNISTHKEKDVTQTVKICLTYTVPVDAFIQKGGSLIYKRLASKYKLAYALLPNNDNVTIQLTTVTVVRGRGYYIYELP